MLLLKAYDSFIESEYNSCHPLRRTCFREANVKSLDAGLKQEHRSDKNIRAGCNNYISVA